MMLTVPCISGRTEAGVGSSSQKYGCRRQCVGAGVGSNQCEYFLSVSPCFRPAPGAGDGTARDRGANMGTLAPYEPAFSSSLPPSLSDWSRSGPTRSALRSTHDATTGRNMDASDRASDRPARCADCGDRTEEAGPQERHSGPLAAARRETRKHREPRSHPDPRTNGRVRPSHNDATG